MDTGSIPVTGTVPLSDTIPVIDKVSDMVITPAPETVHQEIHPPSPGHASDSTEPLHNVTTRSLNEISSESHASPPPNDGPSPFNLSGSGVERELQGIISSFLFHFFNQSVLM